MERLKGVLGPEAVVAAQEATVTSRTLMVLEGLGDRALLVRLMARIECIARVVVEEELVRLAVRVVHGLERAECQGLGIIATTRQRLGGRTRAAVAAGDSMRRRLLAGVAW